MSKCDLACAMNDFPASNNFKESVKQTRGTIGEQGNSYHALRNFGNDGNINARCAVTKSQLAFLREKFPSFVDAFKHGYSGLLYKLLETIRKTQLERPTDVEEVCALVDKILSPVLQDNGFALRYEEIVDELDEEANILPQNKLGSGITLDSVYPHGLQTHLTHPITGRVH